MPKELADKQGNLKPGPGRRPHPRAIERAAAAIAPLLRAENDYSAHAIAEVAIEAAMVPLNSDDPVYGMVPLDNYRGIPLGW